MYKTIKKLAFVPLTFSLVLAGCENQSDVASQASSKMSSDATAYSESISAAEIRRSAYDVASRSAQWQLDQLGNLSYIPESHRAKSENPKFWIQATFYIGLTKWIETAKDKELLAFVDKMARDQNYELLLDRPYHADDHTIGQTYLWLTEQTGNQQAYKPTQKLFDWILANPPQVGLKMIDLEQQAGKHHIEGNCQTRWCWADALFMAPRTWLKLSNVTGDPKYFEYADKEFWASADYLFSDQYGLFFRDSRYFDMKSDNGEPVFWGRGNGWVFAAIPLIIDDLPEGHPSRKRYIELYKKNAEGLLKLQNDNGYWPVSLMDPDKVKTPEISGTGFITYGLAWGVNNGILTDQASKKAVEKGWAAIEKAVDPNGRVNWVQHVGKSPEPVKKTDSQLYGVGAVLLAAAEMAKWSD
ncbi:MAG: glycoside hydrolase family 88 protein [Gammaproteobacteria bacterium]|nr:glycoside hydrolase family 88 protein [Gammaproteobacteria bacterium]